MRKLFTAQESGLTRSALRWGEDRGRWRRLAEGVYGHGAEPPGRLDQQRARVLAAGSVASGALAGVLLQLDGIALDERPIRRRVLPPERTVVVGGIPCTDGLQTLLDLAAVVDDVTWEQALECALRRRLTTLDEVESALAELHRRRGAGAARMRRVLALRPIGAPPTESLLETLMVQLLRTVPGFPTPIRQHVIRSDSGAFIARLDLCCPELGVFFELDGQHHKDQPVYDARRETAVVAATGWLPGRFTWQEITRVPRSTAKRAEALAWQGGWRAPRAS